MPTVTSPFRLLMVVCLLSAPGELTAMPGMAPSGS